MRRIRSWGSEQGGGEERGGGGREGGWGRGAWADRPAGEGAMAEDGCRGDRSAGTEDLGGMFRCCGHADVVAVATGSC